MRVPRSLLLVVALTLTGCDTAGRIANAVRLPVLTRSGARIPAAGRPYPERADLGPTLDIEVVRDGNAIVLDNRTVREYEGIDLWLNQEYGGSIDHLPVGRGKALALTSFINRYGEHYPVAKFLQPEIDRSLISAELFLNGKLHKLTVRLADDWREP